MTDGLESANLFLKITISSGRGRNSPPAVKSANSEHSQSRTGEIPVPTVIVRMKEDVHRRADIDEGIRRFRYPYKDVDQAVPEWDCLYLCNKRDDIDYTTMYRAPLKEWEEEHHE